jgi:hypothetical protein
MADVTLPGSGSVVATDTVGTRQFQAVKIDMGAAGITTPWVGSTSVVDNQTVAPSVRVIGQDTIAVSFTDTGTGVVTTDMTQLALGSGMGVSQSGGNLLITTGVTANSDFLVRSNLVWRSSWMLKVRTTLSQRIANNNFYVIMGDVIGTAMSYTMNSATSVTVTFATAHTYTAKNVGQFMFIGAMTLSGSIPGRYAIASVPSTTTLTFTVSGFPATGTGTLTLFGHSHCKILYNGTTATNMNYDLQRKGWATGDTVLTVNSTTAPGHMVLMNHDDATNTVGDTLVASVGGTVLTSRGSRMENLPNDNLDLALFFWVFNGTTAPASTTTWTIGAWSIERFANLPVYIAGSRLQGDASPLPIRIIGSGVVTNAPTTPSTTFINSAATTNATSIKASAGTAYSIIASNTNAAARYVKFYNLATAPTVGTSTPVFTMAIPTGGTVMFDTGATGMRFSTGIALAITGAAADTDTTVIVASDVKVAISFI